MSRLIQEKRLLRLLRSELNEEPIPEAELSALFGPMSLEDWSNVMNLAVQNRVCPLLFGAVLRNRGMRIPMQMGQYLQRDSFQNSMAFYQKFSLVCGILELMKRENVNGCILKGVTLSALFPTQESRTFSDIDVFVPDAQEYSRLIAAFEAGGFQKENTDVTDYHESFLYEQNGVSCETEIHYRLNTQWGNERFDSALKKIYRQAVASEPMETIRLMDVEIPSLPVTLNALYLLLHLFQHFMNKGFGIRLFLDWAVFWKKNGCRVDCKKLEGWLEELSLGQFADVINHACVEYLGMELPDFGWLRGEPDMALTEELLDDVFAGGDFGKNDKNRMIVTPRKASITAYLMELHRQTQHNYPRASKIKLLLPALWVATALMFQYRNMTKRKIRLKAVFASSNKRNMLAQKLHIFKES